MLHEPHSEERAMGTEERLPTTQGQADPRGTLRELWQAWGGLLSPPFKWEPVVRRAVGWQTPATATPRSTEAGYVVPGSSQPASHTCACRPARHRSSPTCWRTSQGCTSVCGSPSSSLLSGSSPFTDVRPEVCPGPNHRDL